MVSKLLSFLGDVRWIKNWTFPPKFVLGEVNHEIDLAMDYRAATKILKPGDILVATSSSYVLSNRAIPGSFKHAMVYTGPVSGKRDPETGRILKPKILPSGMGIHQTLSPRTVIHATSDGVICEDLLGVMAHYDYMAAFRFEPPSNFIPEHIVDAACRTVGLPYDFSFQWGETSTFCCTELVDHCVHSAGLTYARLTKIRTSLNPFAKKQMVTVPDDYIFVGKMVWNSISCNKMKFMKKSLYPKKMMDTIADSEDMTSLV